MKKKSEFITVGLAFALLFSITTVVSAMTVLEYEAGYPIDSATLEGNATYEHIAKLQIGSNSTVGPLILNIMYNASAGWVYENHTVTLNNSSVLFSVSESDVSIENRTVHRVSFYNDSLILPPPNSTVELVLKTNLRSPDVSGIVSGIFIIAMGGVYAPDTTVLPLKNTTITVDVTPPAITNVQATSITTSSATILWDTDEISNSSVNYGTTSGNYTSSSDDLTNVTSHSIGLSGLVADTTYFYVVNSMDPFENSNQSAEHNFTTARRSYVRSSSSSSSSSSSGGGAYLAATPTPTPAANATSASTRAPVTTPTKVTTDEPTQTTTTVGAESTAAETPTTKLATKGIPGFESVFAIAGILSALYLMLRRRQR